MSASAVIARHAWSPLAQCPIELLFLLLVFVLLWLFFFLFVVRGAAAAAKAAGEVGLVFSQMYTQPGEMVLMLRLHSMDANYTRIAK